MMNMDETPVYYDQLERFTMESVGAKSVEVHHTGSEKSRFTVVVTIKADGQLLPFYVILKGANYFLFYYYIQTKTKFLIFY